MNKLQFPKAVTDQLVKVEPAKTVAVNHAQWQFLTKLERDTLNNWAKRHPMVADLVRDFREGRVTADHVKRVVKELTR